MSFSKDYNSCSFFTDWCSKQLNKPIWQPKVYMQERDSYYFLHVWITNLADMTEIPKQGPIPDFSSDAKISHRSVTYESIDFDHGG